MAKVELTAATERDLTDIYEYTFREYGERQADRYLQSLEDCFQRLASHPLMARSAEKLRPGYRKFDHARHVIFFVIIEGGIRIVRVLHQRMDAPRHL